LATAEPELSATFPEMVAVVPCANAMAQASIVKLAIFNMKAPSAENVYFGFPFA
jgi:hypothetical protein